MADITIRELDGGKAPRSRRNRRADHNNAIGRLSLVCDFAAEGSEPYVLNAAGAIIVLAGVAMVLYK